MSQRTTLSAGLFATAITTLLTASLAGFSGWVLCVGTDGHRAVELEHAGIGCPALSGPQNGSGVSLQAPSPASCFDLPAAGSGPAAPASFGDERVPVPAPTLLATLPEPARVEMRRFTATHARGNPPPLALHLTSTVLLV